MTKDKEHDDVQRYYNRCRSEEIAADKERDDALIAEAERLADRDWSGDQTYAQFFAPILLELQRSGWQPAPKPDRAEALADELLQSPKYWPGYAAIIRRHFDELRAEWEAERSDEPVCLIGKVDCDGNELVTVSKDALDRYKDQARYTYQRAEKAEARVKELEAERPAVVVPREVLEQARANRYTPVGSVRIMARFILSLDGAKGGE